MKKIFTLFAALAMVMSMSAKPYLRGSFNSWGTSNEFQNGECTINLAANTSYTFKVDENGDWSTSYGNATITSSKCSNVKLSSGSDAKITTGLKGAYKFTWNAGNKTLTVAYPTEEVVKPKKDITVKAKMPSNWTKTIDAWVWTDENGDGKAVTPERDGDWYVITQNTAASYIIFRNGATWNGDANQTIDMRFEDNACIQLAQSGSSKATYTNIDCVSEYTLTATANPAEGGSVTGAGVYEEGTTVILTATPNEGYEFVSWTNGGAEVSTNATYSFVIKKNLALVANFKAVEATVYTISTEAVNGTVTGAGVYEEDATVTLTATPADGYNFKNWTVSGAEVSAENPYIFTATADVTVTANFEEIPVEYETVYFVNAQDWEKVCIYTWTPEIGTWPGKEMTKEAEQIGGKDVYSYTIEKGTTFVGLNFNNGDNGKQTGDLTWTAGKYYVIDNWYTKEEAEEKLAVSVPTYDYYITGTLAGGWDPKQQGLEKDGELYKATFTELNAGEYEFKITAGDWEHQWNYSNLGAAYEEVSQGVDGEGNPNGNIKIVTEEAKNITVIFDATAGKITLEGLTEKVVVISYVLMGVGSDWTTGIALTKNETAEYEEYVLLGQEIAEGDAVKVVTLTNGGATAWCGNVDEYSVAHEFDENGNIVLAPGKYDFYFKLNDLATADDDIIYIGAANPVEPEYNVVEDEITNFVFDLEAWPMVCTGGPSTTYQVEVYLVLTEDADGTLDYENSSVSINGQDVTLIEGTLSNIDVDAPSADAVLRVQMGEEYYELQLAMSAAAPEPIEVVVENATVTLSEYEVSETESAYELVMIANWTYEKDGLTYEVECLLPTFDPTNESGNYAANFYVRGAGAASGMAEGANVLVTVENQTLKLTGEISAYNGNVYNVTISGTLPADEPEVPTALDNVDTTVAPAKVINNGQLIIIRNGVQYNAQGAIVK